MTTMKFPSFELAMAAHASQDWEACVYYANLAHWNQAPPFEDPRPSWLLSVGLWHLGARNGAIRWAMHAASIDKKGEHHQIHENVRWIRRRLADTYSTHLGLLSFALSALHEPGIVIEQGAGFYSTPLLHGWALGLNGGTAITWESDPDWRDDVRASLLNLDSSSHSWRTPSQKEILAADLIFVDGSVGERAPLLDLLTTPGEENFGGVVVVHDTEPACEPVYKMAAFLNRFAFRYDHMDDASGIRTTMASPRFFQTPKR